MMMTEPYEAEHMRRIFMHPQADAIFKRLLREATVYGQLHALCGIYFTDRAYYDHALKQVRRKAGLEASPEACASDLPPAYWQAIFVHFQSSEGNPPQVPVRMWELSRPALERIKAYLAKGGDINGRWKGYPSYPASTILTYAARSGEREALEYVLSLNVDTRPQANFGMTSLSLYAALGATEKLEGVLQSGLDIDAQDDNGDTALHWAARSNQIESVRWLLERGADPTLTNKSGRLPGGDVFGASAPLYQLLATYERDTLRKRGQHKAIAVRAQYQGKREILYVAVDDIKQSPDAPAALSHMLLFAISRMDDDLVKRLLALGAELPNGRVAGCFDLLIRYGTSLPSKTSDLDIIEMLLDHGARPDLTSRPVAHVDSTDGPTIPIGMIRSAPAYYTDDYFDEIIPTDGSDESEYELGRILLADAVRAGRLHLVKHCIARGVRVNFKDESDRRLLQWAVRNGHLEIVHVLLKAGKKRNLSHAQKAELYLIAEASGHHELASKFLWRRSAMGLRPDDELLLDAVLNDRVSLVRGLLALGANANARAHKTPSDDTEPPDWCRECGVLPVVGETALHTAARNGSIEMMKVLLERGADPHVTEHELQMTPLSLLVSLGKLKGAALKDAVALLMAHGADLNTTDKRGLTPLFLTTGSSRYESIQILLALGADANVTNAKGKTLLQMLKSNDRYSQNLCIQSIAELLKQHGASQ